MLDDFTNKLMSSLMRTMDAVDSDTGQPDHKTRLAACKESRSLLAALLPKLTTEQKQEMSTLINQHLASAVQSDSLLQELIEAHNKKHTPHTTTPVE